MHTGYFSDDFRGRPRNRTVDSRPSMVTICCCQVGDPYGLCRFTHARMVMSS